MTFYLTTTGHLSHIQDPDFPSWTLCSRPIRQGDGGVLVEAPSHARVCSRCSQRVTSKPLSSRIE